MSPDSSHQLAISCATAVACGTLAGTAALSLMSAGSGWWLWSAMVGGLIGLIASVLASCLTWMTTRLLRSARPELTLWTGTAILGVSALLSALAIAHMWHGALFHWTACVVIALAAAGGFFLALRQETTGPGPHLHSSSE